MQSDRTTKRKNRDDPTGAAKHDTEANWHLANVNARSFEQGPRHPEVVALSLVKVAQIHYKDAPPA